ncbi:MAG: uL22 family ribosomal protein [Nanoarchaeota archaeon]
MTNTEKPSTKAELKKHVASEVQKDNPHPVTTPKKEESQEKPKAKVVTKPKVKKNEAVINSHSLPISTKYSIAICKFIKGKRTGDAIRNLENVLAHKRAIPMGNLEVPHKKGKGMAGGRYPKKATEQFIKLLKNVVANATVNEIEEPVISEAIANLASRPYGRFGRVRKKRTHVRIVVKEMKSKPQSGRSPSTLKGINTVASHKETKTEEKK